ncbi:DUF4258 domain-containing protein [Cupriavidus oxalaticus]|jgi:hypothetical protein|uniref:DUF4258 domain-containing protein n=1 Tax=Cupriavidus oxalaticus TaxID=96344 RepID=A0A375GEX3_9BURK|nr:DUF4258 domain-containing protein [Cupriavidus oxalaticus]QEZ46000.1 DUF4258 domain-containing protein [Cupriavidus oxalaticus]QRQ86587.1 DUF4258 domain-containing protein [Cupriavidus oxalaticus]QRQ95085.1 DUF4258 domain-containing protein [Cupriavidus oxalaticus]WQD83741.1 DUF4258 domain-containing protein [Cupriavidus oxalaticus]SPC17017.1 conserved hypothetical protein [Cupriavidus oxalaticus]
MPWAKRDWETHIRKLCRDTARIFWTSHAEQQMQERHIAKAVALDVLRLGVIRREPEPDIRTGHTLCRMERFCAGAPIGIVVALEAEGASACIVVTAINL